MNSDEDERTTFFDLDDEIRPRTNTPRTNTPNETVDVNYTAPYITSHTNYTNLTDNINNRGNYNSNYQTSHYQNSNRNNYSNYNRNNYNRNNYNRNNYRNINNDFYNREAILFQLYHEIHNQNTLLQSMRNDINSIWNILRFNQDSDRRNNQYMNNQYTNIRPNVRPNINTNQRIYINGVPYIIENIQPLNTNPRNNHTTPVHNPIFTPNELMNTFMEMINFSSNVPIIPSRLQILNATREVQFGDIENPINTSCPISLESFQSSDTVTQILHCGHNFNTRQLNTWFQTNVRCPMCRYDIRDYIRRNREPENNTTEAATAAAPADELRETNNTNNTNNTNHRNETRETSDQFNNVQQDRTRIRPRRTFTNAPAFLDTNINNISNNLYNRAFDAINDLFEQNNDTFPDSGNNRLLFDPSNNILLFETIINSTTSNSNSNNRNRDNNNRANNNSRHIV